MSNRKFTESLRAMSDAELNDCYDTLTAQGDEEKLELWDAVVSEQIADDIAVLYRAETRAGA